MREGSLPYFVAIDSVYFVREERGGGKGERSRWMSADTLRSDEEGEGERGVHPAATPWRIPLDRIDTLSSDKEEERGGVFALSTQLRFCFGMERERKEKDWNSSKD